MLHARRPRTALLAFLLLLAMLGLHTSADADTTSAAPDPPTAGDSLIRNPGVILLPNGKFLVASTSAFAAKNSVFTGNAAGGEKGRWRPTNKRLLRAKPSWAAKTPYWAPSIARRSDGHYVVFFAAAVKGTTNSNGKHGRYCIGTGVSTTSTIVPGELPAGQSYFFEPTNKPLVCHEGQGAADDLSDVPDFAGTGRYTIIDPTPAQFDRVPGGGPEFYLTYKTSVGVAGTNRKVSTLRMVRLDDAHPERKVFGETRSKRLTRWDSRSIEENPVLIKAGDKYVLFSSRGWFDGNCSSSGTYPYQTYFRVSDDPWGWGGAAPTKLSFPATFKSCGSGNAQVVQNADGQWRIWFNGKYPIPRKPSWHDIPFGMYVGALTFSDTGRPRVKNVYR